jgi:hypothetical protein
MEKNGIWKIIPIAVCFKKIVACKVNICSVFLKFHIPEKQAVRRLSMFIFQLE